MYATIKYTFYVMSYLSHTRASNMKEYENGNVSVCVCR